MVDAPVETVDAADVDGRRLRRERGRRAVMDALIDLVLEGAAPPTAAEVAERAGVSQASLYRYFATLDDLRHAAIGHYFERFGALIAIADLGRGDLADRIDRFVAGRDAFYARTAPVARLVRQHVGTVDELAVTLARLRATFVDQVDRHFAPELGSLPPAARTERSAVLAAITSFEVWEQLAALGDRGRRAAWARTIADLVAPESSTRVG